MRQLNFVDMNSPGAYQPFLVGWDKSSFIGVPLVLGYQIGGMACGILIADNLKESITLKWIAVDQNCQGRGIGKRLIDGLYQIAEEAGITQIDAIVCLPLEAAEKVNSFLYHRGLRKKNSTESYSISLETISKGPLAKLFKNKDIHIRTLKETASYHIRNYNQKHHKEEGFQIIIPEELLPESVVWMEEEEIQGCVLLASCGEGIELRLLSGNGSQMLASMLAKACDHLIDKYPMDTKIYVTTLVDSAKRLVTNLAGNSIVLENPVSHYIKEW